MKEGAGDLKSDWQVVLAAGGLERNGRNGKKGKKGKNEDEG